MIEVSKEGFAMMWLFLGIFFGLLITPLVRWIANGIKEISS